MSADSLPITPTAFAAALQDLPLSALHLKVLELRNSIAHLDYSNEQLRPFAEGTATALSTTSTAASTQTDTQTQHQTEGERGGGGGGGDPECADAIRENEQVIERMQERIRLVRAEVEGRGLSWAEFSSQDETTTATIDTKLEEQGGEGLVLNGVGVNGATEATTTTATATGGGEAENGGAARRPHTAWSDGTFQTGVIRGGVVHMDGAGGGVSSSTTTTTRQGGGSLTDEELRRRMEEQLRDLGGDEEDGDGLHL